MSWEDLDIRLNIKLKFVIEDELPIVELLKYNHQKLIMMWITV